MPWHDLDADGYTGIELWSFVTDSAERVNSIRDLLSFMLAPAAVPRPPAAAQPRRMGPALRSGGDASAWAASTRTRSGSASPAACRCA